MRLSAKARLACLRLALAALARMAARDQDGAVTDGQGRPQGHA